jgi:flavin-dependent dehydrogenase
VIGKLHIPNVSRRATAPGLALVGDAALAIDPLGAVGCGWAMQSAEWLADSVSPALAADESLARGLARYRRRRARALRGHALVLQRNSRARPFDARARLIVSAAVEDRQIAATLEQLLTCSIGPGRYLARTLTRAIALRVRGRRAPSQIAVRSGAGSPEEASPDAGV